MLTNCSLDWHWRHRYCRRVDICQGCRVISMCDRLICDVGGRDVGLEGQGLQLFMHCKCNAKPELDEVGFWLALINGVKITVTDIYDNLEFGIFCAQRVLADHIFYQ